MSSKRGSPSSDTESSSKRARNYPFRKDSHMNGGKDYELTFFDETIERSSTVSLFLQTCQGQTPKLSTQNEVLSEYSDLIDFCKKYDAAPVLRMISASLYRWFHEIDLGSCHIFILGCLLDTPKVVAFALRNSKPLTWSANKMLITEEEKAKARNPITTLENIVDARWTDPSSWSIELIEMIPEAYLFAMLRANKHGGTDAEKVADGFVQIMKEMGEYTAKSNNVLTDLVPHIRAKPMFASCRYRLLLDV
ncbi:hypothetical protein L486_07831 [Kwoniella mangroviensis CBS 10435]|uniref:BTB domain-containing protein n=1 Tax=Kwoniella mangroviensis CBS 10435 TaxID=1331196 RepID=A0A1B9IH07_9TREE|nr:hypothetical protein L486_07831 [Kwoniella mangroviensis CBS 10435]